MARRVANKYRKQDP